MTTARDDILKRVRMSLDATANDGARRDAAMARITNAGPRHPAPGRIAGKSPREIRDTFLHYVAVMGATPITVADDDDVPGALAEYLRSNNLPQRVRMGDDARLNGLPWAQVPSLTVERGSAAPDDDVAVSHATAGVAETGTLVMESGPDNPVTLNFMPDTHVVVVRAEDLVGPYEDAFDAIRTRRGHGTMPRTVNMISGPSRTGDIGGRIVMGAHGPRRMAVIVIGAAADGDDVAAPAEG